MLIFVHGISAPFVDMARIIVLNIHVFLPDLELNVKLPTCRMNAKLGIDIERKERCDG
ncbi:hypothetical protein [Pseudoalteromonas byunsanensis]|nr:hypothetical protein [Pseudoalteromonas byunsanensis]